VSQQRADATMTAITTDDLFKTLSNRRRRYVLHYLKQQVDGEGVPIGTLAKQVAAWENDVESSSVDSKQRKRVYTALHQTHLPQMGRMGIINYDASRGTVTLASSLEPFDIYFELKRADDVPWSHVYLGVGGVAMALMSGVWLSLWPFATVPGVVYASLFAVLLVVLGGYHTIQDRRNALGADAPPELSIPAGTATVLDVQAPTPNSQTGSSGDSEPIQVEQ